ncbi:type I polyketide synthase, partial [Streptomyces cacaoi]|uniref:type I polyketide synthase n=2 Tax=Streptomyces cacaoi TaxID=1898 RepID=UPI0036F9CF32
VGELEAAGARVRVVACDVAERAEVARLVDGIVAERPLTGVIHAAGIGDSALVDALTTQQLHDVLAPKADAAWWLHEVTRRMDLAAFVLFSSAGGLVLTAGQGNYAAANVFLDALAQRRRAEGLAATSMAFGLWEVGAGLGQYLSDIDRARMATQGVPPLSYEAGLELFAAGLRTDRPSVVPVHIDTAALRSRTDEVPALLRGLAPAPRRAAAAVETPAGAGELERRLVGLTVGERLRAVLELVRGEVAGVLGHSSVEAVGPERPFRELGFDSLAATELRNQLNRVTGLRLPATLVFDYPSARAVAEYIESLVGGGVRAAEPSAVVAGSTAGGAAAEDEPVAIVGMACRYPGGVSSPEDLWRLVTDGVDAISPFPDDRGWEAFPDHDGHSRLGGFLDGAADFDPGFFGISPREALAMDPQQRLTLELTWEALERAGIDPTTLKGSRTGVFAGVMYHDYPGSDGNGSVVSGRVSYKLGLEGPALSVDTACSSSLVALDLAVRSLRQGTSSLAVTGGVTVMATPGVYAEFGRQGALAADGRCKSFASAADGTGFSEGAGFLIVERLSDAVRNGHPVLAVVRGSAVNQDGASNGLTAPNGPAQRRVIQQALADAGLSAGDVDAVEAHGTGTTLGDPIEAQALLATYGQGRDEERPLLLGSVKSNIGHTQAAAGVAGVIKMVMAMRHGVLPSTLHVDEPSTKVDWTTGAVRLVTESAEWPRTDRPRRAAVSSFGISGTNAHVIVEQAPHTATGDENRPEEAPVPAALPWLLSARDEAALAAQARRLLTRLTDSDDRPEDVAFSLATTRAAFAHRTAVVGSARDELLRGLEALAQEQGETVTDTVSEGLTAFLFSGQGAQRLGMGRELYERFGVFAEAFDAVCAGLDARLDRPLKEVVWGEDADLLGRTVWTQAGLFAVEVALFRLVESWGVRPEFVGGHSIGEVAAAHVAGVLSLEDACVLVAARGRLMDALPSGGAMVAVEASEGEVRPHLSEGVAVAAVNGPSSVVVSGVEAEVEVVRSRFEGEGRRTSRLRVSHAFHSPLMEPMLEDFRRAVEGLDFRAPGIPVVSNVTGEMATAEELASPDYWVRHAREAVRFADGVRTLRAQGVARFVELGPDGTLSALAQQSLDEEAVVLPLLRKGRAEETAVVEAVTRLHTTGGEVDWTAFFAGTGARRVDLPTYPFQHQRYWPAVLAPAGDATAAGVESADHPLLSGAVELAGPDGVLLTGQLSVGAFPWLADHVVNGVVVVPGTVLVEWVWRAGDEVGCGVVEELALAVPLVLPERGGVQVQVWVGEPEEGSGRRAVSVHARREGESWLRHAAGFLAPGEGVPEGFDVGVWPPRGAEPVDVSGCYERLAEAGFGYGPVFQGLRSAWRRGEDVFAEVALPEGVEGERFGLHPALFDAALHASLLTAVDDGEGTGGVPFAWSGVRLHAAGASGLRVRIRPGEDGGLSLALADVTGAPVASVDSLVVRPIEADQLRTAERDSLFTLDWAPVHVAADAGAMTSVEVGLEAGALAALVGDEEAPDAVLVRVPSYVDQPADRAHELTAAVLGLVQSWVADERWAGSRLVFVTRGATSGEDLAGAAVWGLVRSAQSEHPGRFVLVDLDPDADADADDEGTRTPVTSQELVAATVDEPQVRVRAGQVYAPRLVRVSAGESGGPVWSSRGRVLVTGGTGGLGRVVARHLVAEHGVRDLLLVSRSGPAAEGAAELVSELSEGFGASVVLEACDVADATAVAELVGRYGDLAAVVHTAGVLDDGVIESLDAERLAAVLRPKVDGAWNLHEATRHLELEAFVTFSSVAGVFGSAGQANYAAGNAFLDALALQRRAAGLPGTSLAWGPWTADSGMTGTLSEAEVERMTRAGMPPLSVEDGLALFDAALARDHDDRSPVLPMHLNLSTLRAGGEVAPLLRGLIRTPRRTRRADTAAASGLTQRLAALPEADRRAALLDLVRGQVAVVLGHVDAGVVDASRAFSELGFD